MGTTDIVARLQLRAEQFASESGARFAELKSRARSAAQDVRESFTGAFAEVQRVAQQALVLPRTETGSLNLSAEIAQLKASAAAAENRGQALRELNIAQMAAANGANIDAEAMRLEADAAAVAALAEERNAAAIRERVIALEAVQRELNQTSSATRRLTQEEEEHLRASARSRQGTVMLGQQFQDFTVQVQSGQSIVTAFVQQIGQAAFALSSMEGKLGAVGSFLVSGWGTAFTIGLMVLVPFVAKLWEGAEAAKAAELASSSLGAVENDLAAIFGKTSSKIAEQNELLLINARIKAANLRVTAAEQEKDAAKIFGQAGTGGKLGLVTTLNFGSGVADALGLGGNDAVRGLGERARNLAAAKPMKGETDEHFAKFQGGRYDQLIKDAEKTDFKGSGYTQSEFLEGISKIAGARADRKIADLLDQSLDAGKIMAGLEKPEKKKNGPKPRDLGGMSNSAEEEIARINAEWDETPRLIDKASLATMKLDHLIGDLVKKKPPNWKALAADAEAAKDTIERGLIRAIGKAFEAPETLADKGGKAIAELDTIIADLEKRQPGKNWPELVAQAEKTKGLIVEGMNRPFTEYVRQQRESLAIGALALQGRDAEAKAMQDALRLQEQMGRALKEDELATVLQIAEQHERIARAIEDQRRVVGIYAGAVNEFQNAFDKFLENGKPGDLLGGVVDSVKNVQRHLLSNAIFGGVDRAVEDYVRKMTGQKTPAEILREQAKDAGGELRSHVGDAGDALADFVAAVRSASTQVRGANDNAPFAGIGTAPLAAADLIPIGNIVQASAAIAEAGQTYLDSAIVVNGALQRDVGAFHASMLGVTGIWQVTTQAIVGNLERMFGALPKGLKDALEKHLPTIIGGIAGGQIGGSVFASITGGRDDRLASSIGGILGNYAGKQLGGTITTAIGGGLGKMLGGAAGPIGSILGGIAGNVISGLFNKPKWGDSTISLGANGQAVGAAGAGRGGQAIAAATGTAGSVAAGINAIADQLGAKILSLPAMTLGMWDGNYRVARTNTSEALNGKSSAAKAGLVENFGQDQQAAIEYAVRYSISNAVMTGISQASQNILKSGQDLEKAISKALLIEAVPRDLKAMLDPVGAAIDDFNRKFQRTVDALKEGGATAEQMAQAERLYDLQLAQIKNSTASATASLKDFRDSLMLGSNSPYSLRDQEATALSKLQPFLDQIAAGQSIDQERYRAAADAYLQVERGMYGSTAAYFDALDTIQAATNKAIATIDNAAPITAAVDSPFPKATAESAAATAQNTGVSNELLAQLSDQLDTMNGLLTAAAANNNRGDDFIGIERLFGKMG